MKEKTMETMTVEERAAHIIDMFHRITVHHTLWFREAEHQLGFEKALNVMDYAWKQTRKAAVRRLAAQFHFPEQEGCPTFLIRLPKEDQLSLLDTIAKSWLAQDGFCFPMASIMRNGATILHGPGSLPLKRTPLKNFLAWKSIPGWKDWRRL